MLRTYSVCSLTICSTVSKIECNAPITDNISVQVQLKGEQENGQNIGVCRKLGGKCPPYSVVRYTTELALLLRGVLNEI